MIKKLLLFVAILISTAPAWSVRREHSAKFTQLSRKEKRKLPKGLKPNQHKVLVRVLFHTKRKKELDRIDRQCYSFIGGSLIEQSQ